MVFFAGGLRGERIHRTSSQDASILVTNSRQLGKRHLHVDHLHAFVENTVFLPTEASILHRKELLPSVLLRQIDLLAQREKLHWLIWGSLVSPVSIYLDETVLRSFRVGVG